MILLAVTLALAGGLTVAETDAQQTAPANMGVLPVAQEIVTYAQDSANEIMPIRVDPTCAHSSKVAFTKTVVSSTLEMTETTHTLLVQEILGTKCTKCGYYLEYNISEPVQQAAVKHKWVVDDVFGYCKICYYDCSHKNAKRTPSVKGTGDNDYNACSPTQHRELIAWSSTRLTCSTCGLDEKNYYTDAVYSDPEDHEFDEDGVCELCGFRENCSKGGAHTFKQDGADIWYDSYEFVDAETCKGIGVHTEKYYSCTKCFYGNDYSGYAVSYIAAESYDPDATVLMAHAVWDPDARYTGDGICLNCGGTLECSHPNYYKFWTDYEDLLIGEEITNNGNGMHTGKMVVTNHYACADCGKEFSEPAIMKVTQRCEYWDSDYDEETRTWYAYCAICGARAFDNDDYCKHDGDHIIRLSRHGLGTPTSDGEKTHTYFGYTENRYAICAICGQEDEWYFTKDDAEYDNHWEDIIDDYQVPHYFMNGVCVDCGYEAVCTHENTSIERTKDLFHGDYSPEGFCYLTKDEDSHYEVYSVLRICEDCGATIDMRESDKVVKPHVIDDTGLCMYCDYNEDQFVYLSSLTMDKKLTVVMGDTAELTAKTYPRNADNPILEWESSNEAVATVDDGEITPVAPGTAKITCSATDGSGLSATCVVTVQKQPGSASVAIQAEKTALLVDESVQLTAVISPANAKETTLTWSSSDPTVATVDEDGFVEALAAGTTKIKVVTGDGVSTTLKLTVTDPAMPVDVVLNYSSLVTSTLEDSIEFKAVVKPLSADEEVVWSSSDPTIATISDEGILQPLKEGTIKITATTVRGGLKATAKVTVVDLYKPTGIQLDKTGTVTLDIDDQLELKATAQPLNAKSEVTWTSSNEDVATVEDGVVTPHQSGTAKITAKTVKGGFAASVKVTVVDPYEPTSVSIEGANPRSMNIDDVVRLEAKLQPDTAQSGITWSSSNEAIAEVDEYGNIEAHMEGIAKFTVKTAKGGFKHAVTIKIVDPE